MTCKPGRTPLICEHHCSPSATQRGYFSWQLQWKTSLELPPHWKNVILPQLELSQSNVTTSEGTFFRTKTVSLLTTEVNRPAKFVMWASFKNICLFSTKTMPTWSPWQCHPQQESEMMASAVMEKATCATQNHCKGENRSLTLPYASVSVATLHPVTSTSYQLDAAMGRRR